MEPLREDQMAAEVRALRPNPRPQFAAELDERAAAGFPRRPSRRAAPARLLGRLRTVPRRRLLLPAGGAAVIAIAITVALIATQRGDSGDEGRPGNESGLLSLTNPITKEPPPEAPAASAASEANVGGGGFARLPQREVERSAAITLAAKPEDVADDAKQVFEAVHANRGIVLRSGTRQGGGEGAATFELLIPSNRLGDAMASFSEIDAVSSRHEATADITAPTVSAAELLRESRARIDSLLGQLEEAESESEREAVEAELRHERRHASRLAAQLQHLHRRADYSRVSLRIESGQDNPGAGGAWGIDDAFHDAGKVLAVTAAAALLALAVLGPIALLALLAWIAHRAWIRRERRRVLS